MDEAVRLFRSTREYLTPVLSTSAFQEKGMLTPEEFLKAGDQLVQTCPTWKWESGDPTKAKPYLPADKQFIMTKGVPSYTRASTLEASQLVEENLEGDGWCSAGLASPDQSELMDGVVIDASDFTDTVEKMPAEKASTGEEYLDMEDESLALDGDTAIDAKSSGDKDNILRVRRYDVSISYDNYYRTPRIWLFGYDENGSALSPTLIFQDIMQDYARKTVTIDPHPHTGKPHASIHPCQHGPAMLKILEALKESEAANVPTVDQYLFIFLKFIQSVVPTVEYDYTMDVQVRGKEI